MRKGNGRSAAAAAAEAWRLLALVLALPLSVNTGVFASFPADSSGSANASSSSFLLSHHLLNLLVLFIFLYASRRLHHRPPHNSSPPPAQSSCSRQPSSDSSSQLHHRPSPPSSPNHLLSRRTLTSDPALPIDSASRHLPETLIPRLPETLLKHYTESLATTASPSAPPCQDIVIASIPGEDTSPSRNTETLISSSPEWRITKSTEIRTEVVAPNSPNTETLNTASPRLSIVDREASRSRTTETLFSPSPSISKNSETLILESPRQQGIIIKTPQPISETMISPRSPEQQRIVIKTPSPISETRISPLSPPQKGIILKTSLPISETLISTRSLGQQRIIKNAEKEPEAIVEIAAATGSNSTQRQHVHPSRDQSSGRKGGGGSAAMFQASRTMDGRVRVTETVVEAKTMDEIYRSICGGKAGAASETEGEAEKAKEQVNGEGGGGEGTSTPSPAALQKRDVVMRHKILRLDDEMAMNNVEFKQRIDDFINKFRHNLSVERRRAAACLP